MRRSRPVDLDKQVERLERKHQELKARVEELDARLTLTTFEEVELSRLKKQKLAAKDALSDLRRFDAH